MTVTTPVTVFTREHCFSKKNMDWICTKLLEINVKYRVAKKKSFFSIDLLLLIPERYKYLVISSGSNKVFNSVYKNNIGFLKNGRLNSHRNAPISSGSNEKF